MATRATPMYHQVSTLRFVEVVGDKRRWLKLFADDEEVGIFFSADNGEDSLPAIAHTLPERRS